MLATAVMQGHSVAIPRASAPCARDRGGQSSEVDQSVTPVASVVDAQSGRDMHATRKIKLSNFNGLS
jgi:hypothetical protein